MGVHGSTGAGGAGVPSLSAALRLAATRCCAPPPVAPARPDEQQPQRRPAVRGGGPGAGNGGGEPQRGAGKLEHALHQRCAHGTTFVLPPLPTVLGGGAPPTQPALVAPAPIDPALVAAAVQLGDPEPSERAASALRQLGNQLATLLASTADRIRVLLPSFGAEASAQPAAQPGARADAPVMPLQPLPPPPIAPVLTLDPALGTIVDAGPADGSERTTPREPGGPGGSGGPGDDDQPLIPTSWVPVALGRLRHGARAGIGTLIERVDALLREVGITRLQLLVLVVVAPMAVAFAIDVVASILEGR